MSEDRPPRPAPRTSRSPLRNYVLLLITGFALVISWDEIGFFVFLLLLGAVLSYLGDQLGSYCGKQRLSILGLRPRYTAGLINLGTGLLITAITFGGAVWVSEDVRTAVFSVSELREQAKKLRVLEISMREDLAKVSKELNEAKISYDAAQKESVALSKERDGLALQTRTLEQQKLVLAQDNEGLAGRNVELAGLNQKLAQSNQTLDARSAQLDRSIEEKLVEIDRLNQALEKKETAPVVISKGQVLLEETAAVASEITTEALTEVVQDITDQIAARVQLLDVKLRPGSARYLVRHGVRQVKTRLNEIVEFYKQALKEGKISETEIPKICHISPVSPRNVSIGERLRRVFFDIRPNLLVLKAGEEVARTVVDGSLPPEKVLDQLLYFDQLVGSALRERGVSATVLKHGRASDNPKRLFQLVRFAEKVHATKASQVVLCRVSDAVFTFVEPTLEYGFESSFEPLQGSPSENPDAPSIAVLDFKTPDLAQAGFELVLPEPTLSADTLMPGVGASLGAGEGGR